MTCGGNFLVWQYAALIAILATGQEALGRGVSFAPLGSLSPGGGSSPTGMSGDGTVVAGTASLNGPASFKWTSSGGMQQLGDGSSTAYKVARAGQFIAGQTYDSQVSRYRATRWDQAGTPFYFNDLPIATLGATAHALSADGSVAVGATHRWGGIDGEIATRWTVAGGVQRLFDPATELWSRASDVSSDGNSVVGTHRTTSSTILAFVWTAAGGARDITGLSSSQTSWAYGVSSDGSVVVGQWSNQAFRWKVGGVAQLIGAGSASVTSADGRVLGGSVWGGDTDAAFIWREGQSMQKVRQLLIGYGLDMSEWRLQTVYGMSDDGLTLTGRGYFHGGSYAWIATLPSPGGLGVSVGGLAFCCGRRRRS